MEEETMEDSFNQYSFMAYEIDLDYEFDAARFFDFSRAESPLEARQAEVWFASAATYPPSPFAARLFSRDNILTGNITFSPKSNGVENMNLSESDSDVDTEVDHESSAVDINHGDCKVLDKASITLQTGSRQNVENPFKKLPTGLTFYNHMMNDKNSKVQTKMSVKPSFPRTSTLMKPTASQLAKQSHPLQTVYPRSNMSITEKTDKSSASTCRVENQAAKRQKLEGGLLRKVVGAVELQQTNFVHKAPKRDGFSCGNSIHTNPRITIPRAPDLETAHRAQRTRPRSSKEAENGTSTIRKFKALPLNRKILEAPSSLPKRSIPRLPDFHEFHLKTQERAMQHSSAVPKSTIPCNNSDKALHKYTNNLNTECRHVEPERPSRMDTSRSYAYESSHSFKALPLNKKILTSKGDIGVFRNNKKESTVPMEFNFQTEKKFHHNPPIDLFNKLSLASETRLAPNPESKLPRSTDISSKGSKENRWVCFQQENEIKEPVKLKPSLLGGKH
ncbi:hypothetical protein ACJIZ3_004062 [Penstemon smallii]|uniref:TPX2 central domain-containing protein n=1 Tax=Penstemon smallii TaxID=265156 RepID=A0ABD3S112_9LAMI